MSNHEQLTPSHPKSDVRNTIGKNKQTLQGSARTTSVVDLEEFCEKHYEKLLPIMADKYEYEQRKKEKLEEVKARLDFGEAQKKSTRAQESTYSESRTMSPKRQRSSRSPRHNPSVFTRLRHERSRSSRHEYKSKARRESTVFKRLGREDGVRPRTLIAVRKRYTENHSESEDSEGGHWKSKSRRRVSVEDDDLSQPWAAAKKERWAMPTWCHMFNSHPRERRVWLDLLRINSPFTMTLRGSIPDKLLQHKKMHQRPHSVPNQARTESCTEASYKVATSFLQGKEAAFKSGKGKKASSRNTRKGVTGRISKKGGGFRSQHKQEKRPDRFTLLTKTPREILALEKGKFKTPPPMTTPVEKWNANKFCEFHGEVGHNIDECNHLRRQIKDILKAGKLSHIIKELKQNRDDEGAEGPLIIEAEIGGHQVHRMCVDGGSSFEILYEHCFNRLRPKIRNQMIPATTSLVGFSGEIKWPLGQITFLVKIRDDEYSTSTWMDFMIVRSTSPYNGIIGRPGLRKIHAVPSTRHGMIKFLVTGGITLC
ncbi:reverse transcriptase domain-containing protein [Tanacetum coccineum]